MDSPVLIALIVAGEAILVAIVYALLRGDRRKTIAEAGRADAEGDAGLVTAGAGMVQASGAWVQTLVARVTALELALESERVERQAERGRYEDRIRELEAQVAALRLSLGSRDESQQQVGILRARLEAAEEAREHWRAKARRWAELLAEHGVNVDGPPDGDVAALEVTAGVVHINRPDRPDGPDAA
jgi:hypothetical protein